MHELSNPLLMYIDQARWRILRRALSLVCRHTMDDQTIDDGLARVRAFRDLTTSEDRKRAASPSAFEALNNRLEAALLELRTLRGGRGSSDTDAVAERMLDQLNEGHGARVAIYEADGIRYMTVIHGPYRGPADEAENRIAKMAAIPPSRLQSMGEFGPDDVYEDRLIPAKRLPMIRGSHEVVDLLPAEEQLCRQNKIEEAIVAYRQRRQVGLNEAYAVIRPWQDKHGTWTDVSCGRVWKPNNPL